MPGSARFTYECFVINLDRQPERYAEFQEWNGACGLTINRFPAVDGASLDEATRRTVSTSDRLTRGMIGSALSHKRLWGHAVKTFRPVTVFEDDAVLRSDIADVLPSVIAGIRGFWDIILLGFNTNSVLRLRPGESLATRLRFQAYPTRDDLIAHRSSRDPVTPLRLTYAFGLCGYIVSPLGATKLLKLCLPIDDRPLFALGFDKSIIVTTVDTMMNVFYSSMDAYICLPPLVMTPNDPATSGTLAGAGKARGKRTR